MHNTVLTSVSS